MLYEFLLKNKNEILACAEKKTLELAGVRQNSDRLKKGLAIFFEQLLSALKLVISNPKADAIQNAEAMSTAAGQNDERGVVMASTHPEESEVASEAGKHAAELLRLGYTLSHVVHSYGAMCQSITEIAAAEKFSITSEEFHDFNRCLDVAIAGAVTTFQELQNKQISTKEVEHLGQLAHEIRNVLGTVTMSLDLIKEGTVGFKGNTGQVLDRGLKRIADLVDRSLTEVRLRVEPKVSLEPVNLFLLVDQISLTAEIEARSKKQILEIRIDPELFVEVDRELIYSAISNLVQNAIKFTKHGGKIQVRSSRQSEKAIIEVEDECGGLSDTTANLFKAFEQRNENRTGLGLGLTIAERAVKLNRGSVELRNLPGKGCIFKIVLPLQKAVTELSHTKQQGPSLSHEQQKMNELV